VTPTMSRCARPLSRRIRRHPSLRPPYAGSHDHRPRSRRRPHAPAADGPALVRVEVPESTKYRLKKKVLGPPPPTLAGPAASQRGGTLPSVVKRRLTCGGSRYRPPRPHRAGLIYSPAQSHTPRTTPLATRLSRANGSYGAALVAPAALCPVVRPSHCRWQPCRGLPGGHPSARRSCLPRRTGRCRCPRSRGPLARSGSSPGPQGRSRQRCA
jgi:hypothetical protein